VDRCYGVPPTPIDDKIKEFHATLFGDQPVAACLLAWENDAPVGLASYSILWPAGRAGTSVYLKRLYVVEAYRGRGVGRALMRMLCSVAVECGHSGVEWTTDDENIDAQRFYEELGAPSIATKVLYRLDRNAIRTLAGDDA
jgi:GNAT superfamily N-acetyltransferase